MDIDQKLALVDLSADVLVETDVTDQIVNDPNKLVSAKGVYRLKEKIDALSSRQLVGDAKTITTSKTDAQGRRTISVIMSGLSVGLDQVSGAETLARKNEVSSAAELAEEFEKYQGRGSYLSSNTQLSDIPGKIDRSRIANFGEYLTATTHIPTAEDFAGDFQPKGDYLSVSTRIPTAEDFKDNFISASERDNFQPKGDYLSVSVSSLFQPAGEYMAAGALSSLSANWQTGYGRVSALTSDIPADAKFTDTVSSAADISSAIGLSGYLRKDEYVPAEISVRARVDGGTPIADIVTNGQTYTISAPSQINADWTESDPDKVSYIRNKPELSGFARKTDLPTKASDLENDVPFLSAHQSLSGYATEEWVRSRGYLSSHQSLSDYATKDWVENKNYLSAHQSLSGYATEEWVRDQNYLTEHQSLSDYARRTDIGNGTVTIRQGLETRGSFTLNQSGDVEIQLSAGMADVEWGDIGGDISDQSDLKGALDLKADLTALGDYALSADVEREIMRVEGEIPTKVSQLENDAGYLSAHQSLEAYPRKANVQISYSDVTKRITLDADGHVTEIDAQTFIKDGMVESVRYDSTSRKIIIRFNTDAGSTPISVDVGDLVHEYSAGTGLALSGSEFSIDSTVATKDWVEDQNYLTAHQSLDGYATEDWVLEQRYLSAHQSLSGYYPKTETSSAAEIASHNHDDRYVKDLSVRSAITGGVRIASIIVDGREYELSAPTAGEPAPQEQADWTELDSGKPSFIRNKPNLNAYSLSGHDHDGRYVKGVSVVNDYATGTRIATIRVDGTEYGLSAPTAETPVDWGEVLGVSADEADCQHAYKAYEFQKGVTFDSGEENSSQVTLNAVSTDLVVDGIGYVFGRGDFGPSRYVVSSDLVKEFSEGSWKMSNQVIADRSWTNDFVGQRLEDPGLKSKLVQYMFTNVLSVVDELPEEPLDDVIYLIRKKPAAE